MFKFHFTSQFNNKFKKKIGETPSSVFFFFLFFLIFKSVIEWHLKIKTGKKKDGQHGSRVMMLWNLIFPYLYTLRTCTPTLNFLGDPFDSRPEFISFFFFFLSKAFAPLISSRENDEYLMTEKSCASHTACHCVCVCFFWINTDTLECFYVRIKTPPSNKTNQISNKIPAKASGAIIRQILASFPWPSKYP